jgi:YesN/AraC family two-component response regulator
MRKIKILWTDDEIDLLRPHIIFLREKGYDVDTASNGSDALELVKKNYYDIIFLDENMPGLSGLETLSLIKTISPDVKVVMITKNEEESIMDEAIGSKITDYLIKPVNPKQILLSLKKNVEKQRLITMQTTSVYQNEFMQISNRLGSRLSPDEWIELYRTLVYWELELSSSDDKAMDEVLTMQKSEANQTFFRFIKENYFKWFGKPIGERPLFSTDIFRQKVFPLLQSGKKVFVLVIDNLRFDQWRVLSPVVGEHFRTEEEILYFSILPTATMYARNALFAGLFPSEIEKLYPSLWDDDDNEGNKNQHEEELLQKQMIRLGRKEKLWFDKVSNLKSSRKISDIVRNIHESDLSVMVFNFVDMISHARTEMDMIRELASDEKAYRSLTLSWFNNSSLLDLLKALAGSDIHIVITTDHGTIRVDNPVKVIGDRETSTNLRYKLGRNLNYKARQVFEVTNPKDAFLPMRNVSTSYIFAQNKDFFVYPNNYNYYANYFDNTFQHGGISLEEMLVPFVILSSKK